MGDDLDKMNKIIYIYNNVIVCFN